MAPPHQPKSVHPAEVFLFILNIIFFIIGAFLIVIGVIVVQFEHQNFPSLGGSIKWLPLVVLAVGILSVIVALFGCVGVCTKNRCVLYLYSLVVFLLLLAQIAGGVYVLLNKTKIPGAIKNQLNDAFGSYATNKDDKVFFDDLQKALQCCGVNNYTDYHGTVASSCCQKNATVCNNATFVGINTEGCYPKVISVLKKNALRFMIVGAVHIVEMILALLCSCLVVQRAGYEHELIKS